MFSQLQNSIINESISWIGTKFHHQGRVKKSSNHDGGCDCIGLIIGVAKKLKLKSKLSKKLEEFDRTDYPRHTRNILEDFMNTHFYKISENKFDQGDLILFKIGKYLQHVGMIYKIENSYLYIIHSHISIDSVVMHRIDEYWEEKISSYYRFADLC